MSLRIPMPVEHLALPARVRLLEEAWLAFPVLHPVTAGVPVATFDTSTTVLGGLSIDRFTFRELLPDRRWYVYAAGLVNPADANTATLALVYVKDDMTTVSLGSTTKAGAGWVKFALGPFDVFGTATVPAAESIACVRFTAVKSAGAAGSVEAVCIWTRFLPAKQ